MSDSVGSSADGPRTTREQAWGALQANLALVIDTLEERDILVLSRRDANVFVQVLRKDGVLYAEAASNQFIEPPTMLLNKRQFAMALSLGWNAPTALAHDALEKEADDEPYEGSPNFHAIWTNGWNSDVVARLLVDTLRRVYGIRQVAALQYRSFTSDHGTSIRWPTLHLPLAPLPAPPEPDTSDEDWKQ